MYDELIDHVQISLTTREIGLMVLDKLEKDPNQKWQFRVWQDEKDPNYFYVLGRVPPPEWSEQ